VAAGVLLGAMGVPIGWHVSDRLESNNAFCTSCHLDAGTPLHREIARDFELWPVSTLASKHGKAAVEGRAESAFRCVDCHGGTGLAGRARVKVLAAKDAFWYVLGRFDEPKHMSVPLPDEDCSKCHAGHPAASAEPGAVEPFHALAVHNTNLGISCVACHEAHVSGGRAEAYFLRAERVMAECARCHPGLPGEAGAP
jgi:nitrate/TMAO reductase-like tetraheme cytochrome c subunit